MLVPFGDDFKFTKAAQQFNNMDKLIARLNARHEFGIDIRYSTVGEYLRATNAQARVQHTAFPVVQHSDFFPYADNSRSYWTGFYTSRPTLKRAIRELSSALRSAEMLFVFARAQSFARRSTLPDAGRHYQLLESARLTMAAMMHHDTVTGTSRQRVVATFFDQLEDAQHCVSQVAAACADALLRATTSNHHNETEQHVGAVVVVRLIMSAADACAAVGGACCFVCRGVTHWVHGVCCCVGCLA